METVETARIPCQRWRAGESFFRGADEETVFDRRRYCVDVLEEAPARNFVTQHHYSRSYPAAVFRVGLFGPGAELEEVCVFSVPMNQRVIPAYTGVQPDQGVELGRFVLLDRAPRNSETFFLGGAFELLRKERPHLRSVVSYSDPVPRRAPDGKLLTPGHVGIIYQAHNGRYMGRGSARTLHMAPDGRVVSPRTLSKIRLGETGWESAQKTLHTMGAPERRCGEDGGGLGGPCAGLRRVPTTVAPRQLLLRVAFGQGGTPASARSGFQTGAAVPEATRRSTWGAAGVKAQGCLKNTGQIKDIKV